MSTWEKLAFFSLPKNRPSNINSHAQLPTALVLTDRVRVFFAARDKEQRSSVYFVDMFWDLSKVSFSAVSSDSVLSPGGIGTFEEHGVYPSCVVTHEGQHFMYYIGWNQGVEAPLFYASIGIAKSADGIHFEKMPGPVLSRGEHDPCLVTSPHVYIDDGLWRMTYVSGIRWSRNEAGSLQSHYHIKYAESADGISWRRNGTIAIDFEPGETNIARSSVVKTGVNDYKMWFAYVHQSLKKYRIGYAESVDGVAWQRADSLAGISVDDANAKSMICYPCVFHFQGRLWMLYNGDDFGKQGFGVAILNESPS